jgi:outer membrane OprD family porin
MVRTGWALFAAACACLPTRFAAAQAPSDDDIAMEPNQQSELAPLEPQTREPLEFFAGTKFIFKPRAYYMDRDRDTGQDNVGFALGGALQYLSGWAFDRLQLRATAYTSQDLYGPSDQDGTQLFLPGPEGFTVLGEANAVFRFTENDVLRAGAQLFELPYLGSHDNRMVPNTFEAIALGNASPKGLAYIVGYVDKIKKKDADEFIPMSEAAGVANGNDGVAMAGARYVFDDGMEIVALDQQTTDVFNTLFAKIERDFPLSNDRVLKAGLQYTDQRSVGDELIGGFQTGLFAAKVEYEFGNATLRLGASTTGSEKGIQKPYGNPANYLGIIIENFDRAGEDAWMIGGNYNFKRVGPGDLGLFANIVSGNTPDTGPTASPDETEYDVTVDYRVKQGPAKNLWVRFRLGYLDQKEATGGDDVLDVRLIVNWDFNLR